MKSGIETEGTDFECEVEGNSFAGGYGVRGSTAFTLDKSAVERPAEICTG
jgi:hypothetical protein